MKTFYLLLSAILPLLAASQVPVPHPVNALSESQKFVLPEKQYTLLSNDLTEENLKQWLLMKQLEKPLPNVELAEQKLAKSHPEHERIVKIRESLILNDEEALLEAVLTYDYTSDGDSILTGKVIFEYDESSQGYSFYSSYLDLSTGKWINSYRESYYPDEAGRDTLIISYDASQNGEGWENSSKTRFAYDSNGNIIKYSYFTWNLGEWRCDYINETVYDEMNRVILISSLYRNYSGWDGYKHEYGYNQQGYEILYAMYVWENDRNSWGGYFKIERLVDSNGNLYGYINFEWDYNHNIWIPSLKREIYSFSRENGSEYIQTEYHWNQENSNWVLWQEVSQLNLVNEYEITRTYKTLDEGTGELMYSDKYVQKSDNSDNILFQKRYTWSQTDNKWDLISELNNVYDDLKRIIESLQFFMKDTFILGSHICTFDSIQEINFTPADTFPSGNENFSSVDTLDFVEGDGSLYWNYNLYGIGRNWIEISNIPDLSDAEGISLHYKILVPSNAMFQVILVEESGEMWSFENYNMLGSTLDEWQQLKLLFEGLYWPYDNIDNGFFEKQQVKKIIIQVLEWPELYTSGSFLIDNLLAFNLEKTDSWEILYRNVKKYDAKGNVIADSTFVWDYDSGKLIPGSYSEAQYNDFGRRLQYESYSYYNNYWAGSLKNISTYDERNFMTSSTDYEWDLDKNEWIARHKTVLGYNPAGFENLHETYYYDWNLQELTGYYKHELSYDSGNKKTSEISYSWLYDQKIWVQNTKTELIYNNQDELVKEIFYNWNVEDFSWDLFYISLESKYETVYTSNGNVASFNINQWNEESLQWEPVSKSYYIYKIATGIEYFQEPVISGAFDIYPNPARNIVNLKMKAEVEAQVIFFDLRGNAVKSLKTNASSTVISLQDLSPGIYIIRVNAEGISSSKKLIIH